MNCLYAKINGNGTINITTTGKTNGNGIIDNIATGRINGDITIDVMATGIIIKKRDIEPIVDRDMIIHFIAMVDLDVP